MITGFAVVCWYPLASMVPAAREDLIGEAQFQAIPFRRFASQVPSGRRLPHSVRVTHYTRSRFMSKHSTKTMVKSGSMKELNPNAAGIDVG